MAIRFRQSPLPQPRLPTQMISGRTQPMGAPMGAPMGGPDGKHNFNKIAYYEDTE